MAESPVWFARLPGIVKGLVCFFAATFVTYICYSIFDPVASTLSWNDSVTLLVAQFGIYLSAFFAMFFFSYWKMFGVEVEK